MALTKKSAKEYENISIDDLLEQLTEEDIEKLNQELFDPDDSDIPARDRCAYKLDKNPSGKFDRKKLLDHLEKTAKEEKDWPEQKPYTGEKKGKEWKPKEAEMKDLDETENDFNDEMWEAVKDNATEEDLVEIAALLGIPSLISQTQYHAAVVGGDKSNIDSTVKGGGFHSVAKHENFRLFDDEPPNPTDVEGVLDNIKNNDSKTKDINLNNITKISEERLIQFAEALKTNTNLERLQMSNVRMTDKVGFAFADALKENKTLKELSVESNFLSGKCILQIVKAINCNQALTELRVINQRSQVLGNQTEMAISKEIEQNKAILTFNIEVVTTDARNRIANSLQRNIDESTRLTRVSK